MENLKKNYEGFKSTINIEDEKSHIELTVFPRVYNALANVQVGHVIIVGGKVQKREQLQIVVDSIEKV